MRHVRLGRTGLPVSRLCLGTMTFGLQCDEPTARAILDCTGAAGITFLDTSDVYPQVGGGDTVGRTEEILGRLLEGRRHDFVIATQCFGAMGRHPWDRGLSRKHILDAIDASLRRLFDIDVLACPQCGGRLRLIATVEDPDATRAILAALAPSRERPDRAPPYAPVPDTSHARNPLTARLSALCLGAER